MKLVRKSGTTASQANRGKSVNDSIAEVGGSDGYRSLGRDISNCSQMLVGQQRSAHLRINQPKQLRCLRLEPHNYVMGKLVQRTVEKLDDSKTLEDLQSCLWVAGDLLTKAFSANFVSQFGEIDREEVDNLEGKLLQEALLKALTRNNDPRWVGQILSGLSSSRDRSLLPMWVDYLTKYLDVLKAANGIVYSVLTALHELGEPVFEKDQRSRSLTAVEQTADCASTYLHERGVTVPW